MERKPFPRPDWSPVPREGVERVEGQVLLVDQRAAVATLRFASNAHTDVHAGDYDIHVLCLEGSGFIMSGDETEPITAGEAVLWPKEQLHNLFTTDDTMTTLMVEHVDQLRHATN